MTVLTWAFIAVLALLIPTASALALVFTVRIMPVAWRTELKEFQTLTGAFATLLAAAVALSAAWMGINHQQTLERMRLSSHTAQVAAAFHGEIDAMHSVLAGAKENFKTAINRLDQGQEPEKLANKAFLRALNAGTFYRSNSGEVGMLSPTIAANIPSFYIRYAEAAEIEAFVFESSKPMNRDFARAYLEEGIKAVDDASEIGDDLLRDLDVGLP
jgi:hypothetical protein